jgi:dihydrofolate reductase
MSSRDPGYRSMTSRLRVEGYAIVSAEGMIATGDGTHPPALTNPADQKFFHGSLDHAAVVVHGRYSHEGGPNAVHRKRLIVTRRVAALAPHPKHDKGLLWNPAGASFEAACAALGVSDGVAGIIGGTDVFGLFLPRYDAFHLTRADKAHLPDGRPVFPDVPARTPETLLAAHGMLPGATQLLDPAGNVTLTTWSRSPDPA